MWKQKHKEWGIWLKSLVILWQSKSWNGNRLSPKQIILSFNADKCALCHVTPHLWEQQVETQTTLPGTWGPKAWVSVSSSYFLACDLTFTFPHIRWEVPTPTGAVKVKWGQLTWWHPKSTGGKAVPVRSLTFQKSPRWGIFFFTYNKAVQ